MCGIVAAASGSNIVNVLIEGLKKLDLGRGRHYPIALEGARKLNQIAASDGIHVMKPPEHYGQHSPILHVVPLQLLSHHAKPRNLAKSVTVE